MNIQPLATVALPLRNMGSIAWLSAEGLCRQKTSVPWELIVIQEVDGHEHFDIEPYRQRLTEAGCVNLKIINLIDRVYLPHKWQLAGKYAAKSSVVFLLQAGDEYSAPDRIQKSYEVIEGGADWYDHEKILFYHTKTGALVWYNGATVNKITNPNMAFRTKFARNIPDTPLKKRIDSFLFGHCKSQMKEGEKLNVVRNTERIISAVCTHGHHTISNDRGAFFDNVKPPFEQCELSLNDTLLPRDIIERLLNLKNG